MHRLSACAVPLAVAILLTCLAGSAQGAVIGVQRVVVATTEDSVDAKAATATCPAGKRVVGAGADVTPGNGEVLIDEIRPGPGLTSLTVTASENDGGTGAAWYVAAWAICAYPPPGLELVSATSASSSAGKSVVATCPAGKRVVGAAGGTAGAPGQLLLDGIKPDSGLTKVTVNAFEDQTGTAASWSVTANAVCANPVNGLVRVYETSASDSTANRVQTKGCPPGKQLLGIAGEINSANAQVVLDAVYTTDATVMTAGFAAFEDATGNLANWSVTVYGICAVTAERGTVSLAAGSGSGGGFLIACRPGQELTGGGADLVGGFGQVFLSRVGVHTAETPPVRAIQFAHEDPNGTTNPWSLRGHAICATPLTGSKTVLEQSSDSDLTAPKTVTVTCPAGTRVIGTGAEVSHTGEVLLTRVVPTPGLQSVDVTAYRYAAAAVANMQAAAVAYCATPPPGLQRVGTTSPANDDEIKSATATCPAGKHVLGTGAAILPGSGNVMIDDIRPDAALTAVTVTGLATETAPTFDWSVTAYATCASN